MKTLLLASLLAVSQLPGFMSAHACGRYETDTFVAHEWGTFTSVQGADGVLIPWVPITPLDLPKFVYDRSRPTGDPELVSALSLGFGKNDLTALQRMETPVIYFYSERARTIDVLVKFPLGLVTEWYPQATRFGPIRFNRLTAAPEAQSLIEWKQLQVLAQTQAATPAATLPDDTSGSHYFAARATDANLVRFDGPMTRDRKTEHEKFLFYRGVGQFPSPLKVTVGKNERLSLDNLSGTTIRHAYVFRLRQGQGSLQALNDIGPGKLDIAEIDTEFRQVPQKELTAQISRAMVESLTKEGLYRREAEAMVETWKASWFGEEGVRVLYLVPRLVTDKILPLAIEPRPAQLARVFVGRAELITPEVERHLRDQITRFGSDDAPTRLRAVDQGRRLNLGRFVMPAISSVTRNDSREFQSLGWAFCREITTPLPVSKALTRSE